MNSLRWMVLGEINSLFPSLEIVGGKEGETPSLFLKSTALDGVSPSVAKRKDGGQTGFPRL